jgi:endoglucanase
VANDTLGIFDGPHGEVQGLGLLPLGDISGLNIGAPLPSGGFVAPAPRIQAHLVRSDILAVEIDTQTLIWGTQIPYVAQPGDVREATPVTELTRWIVRDGKDYGYLVGKDETIIRTLDRIVGDPLDLDWADQSGNYRVSSTTDGNFGGGLAPVATVRRTDPIGYAQVEVQNLPKWGSYSTIYLDFDQDLKANQSYQLSFLNSPLGNINFTLQPGVTTSEAIHISQAGFRPDDPVKRAYLSTWMGIEKDVAYPPGLTFNLFDTTTNQVVYTGKTELQKDKDDAEPYKGRNFAATDIYSMDFGEFNRPGTYRVYVDGIGSSLTFKIEDNVWADAYRTSARGFLYQRSGIALEEPYGEGYTHPRDFNPLDGMKIYQSTTSYLSIISGTNPDIFGQLVAGRTDELVPDAYGAYRDAGDHDRNAIHMVSSRAMLELVDLFPDYYKTVNLNIPESSNDLPDTLDEALYGLELYRRTQKADGGIIGGVESSEHPRTGEASYQESLEVFAYAPDVYASYIYAATASQAAYVLEKYDKALAATYLASAKRAMEYAERNFLATGGASQFITEVSDERNLAAINLFRATGDTQYHDLFLATTAFTDPAAQLFAFEKYSQRDAAYVYATLNMPGMDMAVKANAKKAFLDEADGSVGLGEFNSFNWTQENAFEPVAWGGALGSPNVGNILRAYGMTGEQKFLDAAILGIGFSLGANPQNMSYTTGIGTRYPQYPLVVSDWALGKKAAPGTTLYGPNDVTQLGNYFVYGWLINDKVVDPVPQDRPPMESFLDIFLYPPNSEFTIVQTLTPMVYALGFLAARAAIAPSAPPQPGAVQDVAVIQDMATQPPGEPGGTPGDEPGSPPDETGFNFEIQTPDNTSVPLEILLPA